MECTTKGKYVRVSELDIRGMSTNEPRMTRSLFWESPEFKDIVLNYFLYVDLVESSTGKVCILDRTEFKNCCDIAEE